MTSRKEPEVYISVDIESSGPIPGEYSLLSLGACIVGQVDKTFYVELQPISTQFVPEALAVSGLSMTHLAKTGVPPVQALSAFRSWIRDIAENRQPVCVAFNASFDWAFVNWYFHKYLGENPFGIGALDIKAYYMGIVGSRWDETTSSQLPKEFQPELPQTHNALDDARAQAEIFAKLLAVPRPRYERQGHRP